MFFFETSTVFNGETVDWFLTYYLLKLGIRERCSVVNIVLEAGDTTPQHLKINKIIEEQTLFLLAVAIDVYLKILWEKTECRRKQRI